MDTSDFDTWISVRKHYLPNEYHAIYDIINKHSDRFHKLPTLEELQLEVRDSNTSEKLYALEAIETEAEPFLLLDYLKNEYTQKEALFQLDKWVDNSIAFETAEEVVRALQDIATDLEKKVELEADKHSMQRVELFDSDDEISARVVLGFNQDFDNRFQFRPTDYILMGGRRGSGKSLTCCNIANTLVDQGKVALYFSIEMEPREVLQRCCAIGTDIAFYKIRNKTLDNLEWEKVAKWWSTRYKNGEAHFQKYLEHRDFVLFQKSLSREELSDAYVHVVYDPSLTLGKFKAEVQKKKREGNLGIVILDYLNKMKNTNNPKDDYLDWKAQLNMSQSVKEIAQIEETPIFAPFQTDESGEARMSKGILDSCDAAFVLTAYKGDNSAMNFKCTKMRNADEEEFTSEINWLTLKIGPHSVEKPIVEEKKKIGSKVTHNKDSIYDD